MTEEVRERLAEDYAATLTAYGTVFDQETSVPVRFDPGRIAPDLVNKLCGYFSNTPRIEEGHKRWGVALSSRQVGKSATIAMLAYLHIALHPGSTGGLIADKQERADSLFKYINDCHDGFPDEIRPRTASTGEKRQLTFVDERRRPRGKIATYSADGFNVGLGRSWDVAVLSEVPFWPNFSEAWFILRPAFTNRKEALVALESTPAPLSAASAEGFRDVCFEAQQGHSRFDFFFTPFFQSRLNERNWRREWILTSEEMTLLRRFGPRGSQPVSAPGAPYLTLENLAFRRATLSEDPEIRRDPQLFWVFYPTDPISCWQYKGTGAIPQIALDAIANQIRVPWLPNGEGLQIFEGPKPGALYVLGADPSGFGSGDCAAFVVLEIWADEWREVAEYSSATADPQTVARIICEVARMYNDADVVVESNGVGAGTLSLLHLAAQNFVVLPDVLGTLKEYSLKFLVYAEQGKPGLAATKVSNGKNMALLIDAMTDKRLIVRGEQLYAQLMTYRRDKEVQDSEAFKLVRPGETGRGKRDKHHWDRVSALLWACHMAVQKPVRFRPRPAESDEDDVHNVVNALADKRWKQEQRARWNEEQKGRREAAKKHRTAFAVD